MSLIEFIQKLQNNPRRVRVQILYLSVFVFMIVIISFWIFSLKYSMSNVTDKIDEKKSDELAQSFNKAKEQLPSLIDIFKDGIGSFFEEDLDITDDIDIEIEQELEINISPAKLPLSRNIND